jgi:hypothetical protein
MTWGEIQDDKGGVWGDGGGVIEDDGKIMGGRGVNSASPGKIWEEAGN